MKTIILLLTVFFCVPLFANEPGKKINTTITHPTPPTSFSFIRGHKQGKNYTVTWGMTNNSGVDHFIIQYTYEDPNDPNSVWPTIGLMPCTNMPIFKFTDSPFLPGTLNYRIIAVMDDNSTLTSGFWTTYIQ